MPNYCSATIAVRGYKNNVDEFIKYLKAGYDYRTMEFDARKHFYRVFECYEDSSSIEGVCKTSFLWIECAWSVASCLFDNHFSYFRQCTDPDHRNPYEGIYGGIEEVLTPAERLKKAEEAAHHIIHSTNVQAEAERLKLTIEIISSEPGIGFQEHYLINESVLVKDYEKEYREYPLYDWESKEQWEEYFGCEIPLNAEEYADMKSRGIDYFVPDVLEFDGCTSFEANVDMCKNVMCKVTNNRHEKKPDSYYGGNRWCHYIKSNTIGKEKRW